MKNLNLIEFLKEKKEESNYYFSKLETNKGVIYFEMTNSNIMLFIYFNDSYKITIEAGFKNDFNTFLNYLNELNFSKILVINELVKEEF